MKSLITTIYDYLANKIGICQELEFKRNSLLLGLERARIFSVVVAIMFGYFLYADITVYSRSTDRIFVLTIYSIHIISFALALLYLFFYSRLKKMLTETNSRLPIYVMRTYIILALGLNAIASVNSQRVTGKIMAYVMMVLATSASFSIEPIFMLMGYTSIHIGFIFGIARVNGDAFISISNQINSTAAVLGAVGVNISFYRYRKREYMQKKRLIESEENFKKLFEVNPLPLVISSKDGDSIIALNNSAAEFYHLSPLQLTMRGLKDLFYNEKDLILTLNKLRMVGSIDFSTVEHKVDEVRRKWVIASYRIIEYNNEDCILMGATDISELKRLEEELVARATTDELTGILNRRRGMEILEEQMDKASKGRYSLTLCFVDINHLKLVNDNFGHTEGDDLIKIISGSIASELPKNSVFFRYGGDEFVIIFPQTTEEEAAKMMYRVQKKLAQIKDKPFTISISYGLYHCGSGEKSTAKQAVDLADIAMYAGRDNAISS